MITKEEFNKMATKYKQSQLHNRGIYAGQWVHFDFSDTKNICFVCRYEKSREQTEPWVIYGRSPSYTDRCYYAKIKNLTPLKISARNRLVEFALYKLYDKLITNSKNGFINDVVFRPGSSMFEDLETNVLVDILLITKVRNASSEEDAIEAVNKALDKTMRSKINTTHFDHVFSGACDFTRQDMEKMYRNETVTIIRRFLEDFDIANKWCGLM